MKKTHIQHMREMNALTRAELSRCSGVPIRTLEAWEAGVNTPRDVYQLVKVARVLDCLVEELVGAAFDLTGTQAGFDIPGDGAGALVVKMCRPQLFLPSPDGEPFSLSSIRIDQDNAEEIAQTTTIYAGRVKGSVFFVDAQLFPQSE